MADIHARNVSLNAPTLTDQEIAYTRPSCIFQSIQRKYCICRANCVRGARVWNNKNTAFRTAVTLAYKDAIELYRLHKPCFVFQLVVFVYLSQ